LDVESVEEFQLKKSSRSKKIYLTDTGDIQFQVPGIFKNVEEVISGDCNLLGL
jgi:hypothetical protein